MEKMVTRDVDSQIRAVTDEEVEAFSENGWTMLRGFIDATLVEDLRERAKAMIDLDVAPDTLDGHRTGQVQLDHVVDTDPVFRRFALSARLGEAAAQLLGEPVAMRRLDERLSVKPAGEGGDPTPTHQDHRARPLKNNSVMIWIALDEVTPDMGTMWFVNGSHRLGLLGGSLFGTLEQAVERFPRLGQCKQTEPQYYAPGDATVHHNLTVHGTPANTSNRARWSYRVSCFPTDALFTGEPEPFITDGLGLTPKQPFDHPNFPVIYIP